HFRRARGRGDRRDLARSGDALDARNAPADAERANEAGERDGVPGFDAEAAPHSFGLLAAAFGVGLGGKVVIGAVLVGIIFGLRMVEGAVFRRMFSVCRRMRMRLAGVLGIEFLVMLCVEASLRLGGVLMIMLAGEGASQRRRQIVAVRLRARLLPVR